MTSFTHQQLKKSIQKMRRANTHTHTLTFLGCPQGPNIQCNMFWVLPENVYATNMNFPTNSCPKRSTRNLGGFLYTKQNWLLQIVAIVSSCLFFLVHQVRLVFAILHTKLQRGNHVLATKCQDEQIVAALDKHENTWNMSI